MSNPKLVKLVQLLADKTDRDELAWDESEKNGVFQLPFSNSTVRISARESRNHRGDTEYVIVILNAQGSEVEEVSDETLPLEGSFVIMKDLYEKARRKAMGVDRAIDSILDDLDSGIY